MPKGVVLFPEIGRVTFFYQSPVRTVECVSEDIFLISKNKQTSKKNKNRKKQKKLKKKREYTRNID